MLVLKLLDSVETAGDYKLPAYCTTTLAPENLKLKQSLGGELGSVSDHQELEYSSLLTEISCKSQQNTAL